MSDKWGDCENPNDQLIRATTLNEQQQRTLRTEDRPHKWDLLVKDAEQLGNIIVAIPLDEVKLMLHQRKLMLHALGLAGEAGEVADLVKKEVGHEHQIPLSKYRDELGDVGWYKDAVAHGKGLTAQEIGDRNDEKLRERYPNGFEPSRSINRKVEE